MNSTGGMNKLFFFDCKIPSRIANLALPGMDKYSYFYRIYSNGTMFLDRTGTITSPLLTENFFPMPSLKTERRSFSDLCDARAQELLQHAQNLGVDMYVFWSGGIDSTCVLSSLLKHATEEQKKHIVVVMSDDSIREYPLFYEKYIHGRLRKEPSVLAAYTIFGKEHLIINGEHNDQLFGSDMVGRFISFYDESYINRPYDRTTVSVFFDTMTRNSRMTSFWMDIFERIVNAAPMKITTFQDFFWWINFSLKWQLVHFASWAYARPDHVVNLSIDYFNLFYKPFYCTEDFQQWSMNNLDKKIKGDWPSYKWICKDVIYEYTKDAVYRDFKTKYGSRYFMHVHQMPFKTIDNSFNFSFSEDLSPYHVQKNDFL